MEHVENSALFLPPLHQAGMERRMAQDDDGKRLYLLDLHDDIPANAVSEELPVSFGNSSLRQSDPLQNVSERSGYYGSTDAV